MILYFISRHLSQNVKNWPELKFRKGLSTLALTGLVKVTFHTPLGRLLYSESIQWLDTVGGRAYIDIFVFRQSTIFRYSHPKIQARLLGCIQFYSNRIHSELYKTIHLSITCIFYYWHFTHREFIFVKCTYYKQLPLSKVYIPYFWEVRFLYKAMTWWITKMSPVTVTSWREIVRIYLYWKPVTGADPEAPSWGHIVFPSSNEY